MYKTFYIALDEYSVITGSLNILGLSSYEKLD